ncbi:CGNR zinc finger domain-containing protein [Streptomyces axinellae]|uniref:CGNR zinc finger domain-containing protein n=1 Tax=Streptomyces axinellae TaxID=552788 RepID=A0ABN3Q6J9_9ACTN
MNTLDIETGADDLARPEGLAAFVRTHRLSAFGLGARDLPELRELREALRAACLAHGGVPMPPGHAEALERRLSAAALTLSIGTDGGTALRPAPGLTGLAALTAHLAAKIATAAGDGTWQRLKACEARDCVWVYYDRSPAGRRRWCDMAVCGSRAKMRAYRARRAR